MVILAKRLSDLTTGDILFFAMVMMIACAVFCVIAGILKKREDEKNSYLPVRGMQATIIDVPQLQQNTIAFQVPIMFETSEGNRVRLLCKANHDYLVGDTGYLQWQGSRFISFERGKTGSAAPTAGSVGMHSTYAQSASYQGHIPAWKQVELEKKAKEERGE